MADFFTDNKELQFACYCKALSLNSQEEYLINVKQKFAYLLIENKMYNEAKTKIKEIVNIREKHGWKIPSKIENWTLQNWYKSAVSKRNNQDLHTKYAKKAEEILYKDIPKEIVLVIYVNENKNILYFTKYGQKYGFFRYSDTNRPKIGDILEVQFEDSENKEGFLRHYQSKKIGSDTKSEAIKEFQGKLTIANNFGFIDDFLLFCALRHTNLF